MSKDIPTKCRYFDNKLVDLEMVTSVEFKWGKSSRTEHGIYKDTAFHRHIVYMGAGWVIDKPEPDNALDTFLDDKIEVAVDYVTGFDYISIHILCNQDETVFTFKKLLFDSRIDDDRSFELRKEVQEKLCKVEVERIMNIKKEK